MARFTPLAAFVLIFTACAMETAETAEVVTPEIEEMPATPPDHDLGGALPCGQDLVLGENGEPLQVPVLCDPYEERIPDITEEEYGEDLTQPYELPYENPFAY